MKNSTILQNKWIKACIAIIFWTVIWAIGANRVGIELILPKPVTVLRVFFKLLTSKEAWYTVVFSIFRVMLGFLIGCFVGIILAVLTKISNLCDTLFSPLIGIIRTVPVFSFIILALLWIKSDYLPIFIVILIVLPIVWGNVRQGIEQTSGKLLEMSKAYQVGIVKIIRFVYIPSVKPYFTSAAITALGIGWKSGVAAEVLSQPKMAIGTKLYFSKIYLETTDLFAWTIVIIIISTIIEMIIKKLLNRI